MFLCLFVAPAAERFSIQRIQAENDQVASGQMTGSVGTGITDPQNGGGVTGGGQP